MIWSNLKYDDEVISKSSGFGTGYGDYKVEPNQDLYNWYKKLIAIRNNSTALKNGDQYFIKVDDDSKLFAFERNSEKGNVIVVFNLEDDSKSIDIPLRKKKIVFKELITDENGSAGGTENGAVLPVSIPGKSVRIYELFVPTIPND
jgi:hypothetical protein